MLTSFNHDLVTCVGNLSPLTCLHKESNLLYISGAVNGVKKVPCKMSIAPTTTVINRTTYTFLGGTKSSMPENQ